jgi:DNA-binding beta-propeller fold protein YncE
LAFDSAGNLYASLFGNNTIEKFTPDGIGSIFADASDGLNGPAGLAFDSAGNLYAANRNGVIEEFTPNGVGSVFADVGGTSNPQYLAFTNDAGVPLPLANQVPEPTSTMLLLGLGAFLLSARRGNAQA